MKFSMPMISMVGVLCMLCVGTAVSAVDSISRNAIKTVFLERPNENLQVGAHKTGYLRVLKGGGGGDGSLFDEFTDIIPSPREMIEIGIVLMIGLFIYKSTNKIPLSWKLAEDLWTRAQATGNSQRRNTTPGSSSVLCLF
jgi:hypothetical protein